MLMVSKEVLTVLNDIECNQHDDETLNILRHRPVHVRKFLVFGKYYHGTPYDDSTNMHKRLRYMIFHLPLILRYNYTVQHNLY